MQEENLYRHIFRDAWRITWKYKPLWLFGFLAVFWGDIGAYQSLNSALGYAGIYTPVLPSQEASVRALAGSMTTGALFATLFLSLAVLAIAALAIIIITAARGALIRFAFEAVKNKKLALRSGFERGLRAFWPLLGIALIVRFDAFFYSYGLNPLVEAQTGPAGLLLFILAFIVVTAISLVLSFLGIYASALIMIEGQTFFGSLRESVLLFLRNWLVSVELAVLLYLMIVVVGLGALFAALMIAIPFGLIALIAILMNAPAIFWIIVIPLMITYIAALILAVSMLVVFQYTAWILLFLRIRKENAIAKVMRLTVRFERILHRKIV